MERDDMKRRVCRIIDDRKDEMIQAAQTILAHPELGYKEVKTAALVKGIVEGLGLPL